MESLLWYGSYGVTSYDVTVDALSRCVKETSKYTSIIGRVKREISARERPQGAPQTVRWGRSGSLSGSVEMG